jgi:PD-(D/E)XK endonuclease
VKKCQFSDECVLRRAMAGEESSHPKLKGELAELIFALKAASLGLGVCKPYGENLPFDFVVVSGERLLRVQVKSVFTRDRREYFIRTGNPGGGRRRQYTSKNIDFIVAYLAAYDAWYIIPIAELGGRQSIPFHPDGVTRRDGGYFERFREAWHLITSHKTLKRRGRRVRRVMKNQAQAVENPTEAKLS